MAPKDEDFSDTLPIEEIENMKETEALSSSLPAVTPIDIEFQNLTYTVRGVSDNGEPRRLLRGLSGRFLAGQLTAILGPSGAGKTTLLNALAGYGGGGGGTGGCVGGSVRPSMGSGSLHRCAYIMQDALMQPRLFVSEAMQFASELQVADMSAAQRRQHAAHILRALGLAHTTRTYTDKLSGGERKRLCIALELVSNPAILLLDEPTTGLDTHSSKLVMGALGRLAAQGRTVVCTVHQPSPLEVRAYHQVYVVARGLCAFAGPPTRLVPFLRDSGAPCPPTHSPTDYIIELVHMCPQVVEHLAAENAHHWTTQPLVPSIVPAHISNTPSAPRPPGGLTRLNVLLRRMLLQRWRDRFTLSGQIAHHVISALLLGATFQGVGNEAAEIGQNIKLGLVACVFYVYTYVMVSILCFPFEMELLKRENFNKWYGALTHYTAYSLSSIPAMIPNVTIFTVLSYVLSGQPMEINRIIYLTLLGCLASYCSEALGLFIGAMGSIKNGCILGPSVIGPLFALSCYGIGYGEHIEPVMSFLMHFTFMRYILVGCWTALFGLGRRPMDCNALYCHWKDPATTLRDLGLRETTPWTAFAGLLAFTVLHRLLGYVAVRIRLHTDLPGGSAATAALQLVDKVFKHVRKQRTIP